jgi:hypothetical protein
MSRIAALLALAVAMAGAGCDSDDDGDRPAPGPPGVEAPGPSGAGSRDRARIAADAACRDAGEFPDRPAEPESLRVYYGTASQVARDRDARLRATGDRSLAALAEQFEQLAGLYDDTRAQARGGAVDIGRLDAPVHGAERGIDSQARVLGVPACAVTAP